MAAERFLAEDLADLLETEKAGATGLVSLLIQDFSSRVEGYLHEIEDAQASLNFKDLKLYAHTLKSSTRVLGLRAASEICKEIEFLAKDGVYDPQNLLKLKNEIHPAIRELTSFEERRKKS